MRKSERSKSAAGFGFRTILFKMDKAVTAEEMLEKARFYLAPEQERLRQKIRLAARKRAEQEHTWFNRFQKAFETIGLKR